jgi:hypothetical protein
MMLTSVQIAIPILCVVFGSAVVGLTVSKRLAPHHLSPEAKATITVAMAVVGTMTAVVIGFLISNSSTSFKARNAAVAAFSADIAQLDSLLRRYGPETDSIRKALQRYTELKLEDLFPTKPDGRRDVDSPTTAKVLDDVQDKILGLRPGDERQRWLSAQALAAAVKVSAAQSKMVEENANTVPLPFVGAVTLWLAVLYASFGLFAPRTSVTVVALFLSALAVSMAFKLVLDLDSPFVGGIHVTPPPIHISGEPLREALQVIRK